MGRSLIAAGDGPGTLSLDDGRGLGLDLDLDQMLGELGNIEAARSGFDGG